MGTKYKIFAIIIAIASIVGQARTVKFQNCVDRVYGDKKPVLEIDSEDCDENFCYFPEAEFTFKYRILFKPLTSANNCSFTATLTNSDNFYSEHLSLPGSFRNNQTYDLSQNFFVTSTASERLGPNKLVDVLLMYHERDSCSYNIACARFKGFIYNETECTADSIALLLNEIDEQLEEVETLLYEIVSYFSRYLENKVPWLKSLKTKTFLVKNHRYPFFCKTFIDSRNTLQSFNRTLGTIKSLSREMNSSKNLAPVITYIGEVIIKLEKKIETMDIFDNYQELEFLDKTLEQLKSLRAAINDAEPEETKMDFYFESLFLLIESIPEGLL